LNDYRSHVTNLSSEPIPQTTCRQSEYDEKLERCCQRLEQLTNKVDRFINLEQTGKKTELSFLELEKNYFQRLTPT
jgi:hypothetical protein